ncbi:hypothetical protein [Geomesophilobacter sediminis]|uniref:Uncharacterized protein n=1 Tax=Geomesophilobacter sediminis TaxID=2798584 RepID=A0A8J7M189_9BACT|nr:hypothetical protein [Geomesophilobacter sediminis]MBJ6726803.1 hypothetical protein [Geomesophilobacter sediminis]
MDMTELMELANETYQEEIDFLLDLLNGIDTKLSTAEEKEYWAKAYLSLSNLQDMIAEPTIISETEMEGEPPSLEEREEWFRACDALIRLHAMTTGIIPQSVGQSAQVVQPKRSFLARILGRST